MPEGHHTNWLKFAGNQGMSHTIQQQIPGVLHWAHLQPGKPTSEVGSLQCKSHLFHIHCIHTCPNDLSLTSRWVVRPAEINSCSSGTTACCYPLSFSPHHAPDLLLVMHPCLAVLFPFSTDGSALSFYNSFLFYVFSLCFPLQLSPFKSAA